jgi:uncharacterized protein (DUF1800 family)
MSTVPATPRGFVAGSRFGLGLAPDDIVAMAGDADGWLRAQLPLAAMLPVEFAAIPPSASLLAAANALYLRMQPTPATASAPASTPSAEEVRQLSLQARQEVAALNALRLQQAIMTGAPLVERLVRFWSNHFTIANGGGPKRVLAHLGLAWENEAIRAHLGGSFADLLVAVTRHPAMLIYLDNNVSVGPNSPTGKRARRGLNENLAREILELHTLGVDGGFGQQAVTALARMLTGWTVFLDERQRAVMGKDAVPGSFQFVASWHEPGAQRLLGQGMPAGGAEQAERALRMLARHPATARHVATKLARHFVADVPPAAAVSALERVFLDTDGDLPSLHAALLYLEAAWDGSARKLRTPEEYVIAVMRALRPQNAGKTALAAVQVLGQVPFTAPSPAGWPDSAEYWSGPDALMKRIEWANSLSQRLPSSHDARLLAAQLLPPDASLQREVSRAESPRQALALLLASPAFQWR